MSRYCMCMTDSDLDNYRGSTDLKAKPFSSISQASLVWEHQLTGYFLHLHFKQYLKSAAWGRGVCFQEGADGGSKKEKDLVKVCHKESERRDQKVEYYQEVKHCWSVKTQSSLINEPPHIWTFLRKFKKTILVINGISTFYKHRCKRTYSLWMLTTQLPSVPRTWCPPTILVFICTKHDILGLVKATRGEIFCIRWM